MRVELESIYGKDYLQATGMLGTGQQAVKETGFVVTIAGYSPYQRYEDLLDPIGVETDRSRWGFVTRIEHLDKFLGLDPNSTPFKLYSREAKQFLLEKGIVDPSQDMPAGVGEITYESDPAKPQTRMVGGMGYGANLNAKTILIDPMTREEIGAEPIVDQSGRPALDATGKPRFNERDHWFTLQFKLLWKNGPSGSAGAAGGAASVSAQPAPQPVAQPAPKPAARPSSKASSRKSKKVIE
jgi:hypothetical protein